ALYGTRRVEPVHMGEGPGQWSTCSTHAARERMGSNPVSGGDRRGNVGHGTAAPEGTSDRQAPGPAEALSTLRTTGLRAMWCSFSRDFQARAVRLWHIPAWRSSGLSGGRDGKTR